VNESESRSAAAEDKLPLSPLQLFAMKVAIVTIAILAILFGAGQFMASAIEGQKEQLAFLKGGPVFWEKVEGKLYRLADEPDLPPEKKQKIINSLRKLSAKYKPYLDAVAGEPAQQKK
jgi:hypothetical protein